MPKIQLEHPGTIAGSKPTKCKQIELIPPNPDLRTRRCRVMVEVVLMPGLPMGP
jgi:hypothetical protein